MDKLATDAKTALEDLTKKIEKNTPTADELAQTLNQHTQTAATQITDFVNKLKAEGKAHEGEINDAVKQAQTKLQEIATNLQNAVGPETTAKAKKLQEAFETNLEATVTEVKKFAKEVQPKLKGNKLIFFFKSLDLSIFFCFTDSQDNLNKFWQDALNQLTTLIKDTKTAVDEKIEEHQKSHKH